MSHNSTEKDELFVSYAGDQSFLSEKSLLCDVTRGSGTCRRLVLFFLLSEHVINVAFCRATVCVVVLVC